MLRPCLFALYAVFLAFGFTGCGDTPSSPLIAPPQKAQTTRFHGNALSLPQQSMNIAFLDAKGQTHTLKDWQGKTLLVFFGYTHCPDACPTTLLRANEVLDALGDDKEKVQVLFIALDPKRDTPEVLNAYVSAFHPSFLGLYTPPEEVEELAKAFKVFYRIVPSSDNTSYSIDHGVNLYVFDAKGKARLSIPYQSTLEEIVADMKKLVAEAG